MKPCPRPAHTYLLALLCLAALVSRADAASEPHVLFELCVDYHCDVLRPVRLTTREWEEVREMFEPDTSAVAEREQIRQAIALLERLTGRQAGTWRDEPGNSGEGSEIGQLDCIAESKNTTTYLNLLAEDGLLRWHRVFERQRRNPWFFDIHWTAVIEDRSDSRQYAVDSWFYRNGELPVIQRLDAWRAGERFEEE